MPNKSAIRVPGGGAPEKTSRRRNDEPLHPDPPGRRRPGRCVHGRLHAPPGRACCAEHARRRYGDRPGLSHRTHWPDLGRRCRQRRPGTEQDFVVNVGDRVYFELDSYSVSPEAYPRLDAQAQWLQRYPQVTVRIEGNADERGTREYNLALGARRAESIRNYLIDRGIPAGRIDTISFGKERPIAEGASEDSWARNRNGRTAVVSGAPL